MIRKLAADYQASNAENFIQAQELDSVCAGEKIYLQHDIFFGHTLALYYFDALDQTKKYLLEEGVDYQLEELEDTASTVTGSLCYRGFSTFQSYSHLYADYHVFADFIKVEDFNILGEFLENISTDSVPEGKKNLYYTRQRVKKHPQVIELIKITEELQEQEQRLTKSLALLERQYIERLHALHLEKVRLEEVMYHHGKQPIPFTTMLSWTLNHPELPPALYKLTDHPSIKIDSNVALLDIVFLPQYQGVDYQQLRTEIIKFLSQYPLTYGFIVESLQFFFSQKEQDTPPSSFLQAPISNRQIFYYLAPLGDIQLYSGQWGAWQDNLTIPGWVACIKANCHLSYFTAEGKEIFVPTIPCTLFLALFP